ncbi:MAG: hypothetical protein HZC28_20490 [Spirochaetes bacterium]|nr:hypothetical protein [Spirochaetota bacterium]
MRTQVISALLKIHTAGLFAGGWDAKASSVPVTAIVDPAIADITSPFAPADVAVSGFLNDRIRRHLTNRMIRIDEDIFLGGFRKKPGIHPRIWGTCRQMASRIVPPPAMLA